MKPFAAPVDDILFTLTEVGGAASLHDWDGDLMREITQAFASFAEGEIAPLDEVGDTQGCRLEDGRVIMPDGFKQAYADYAEQGWPGLTVPEEYDGQGMGGVALACVSEVFSGANHSMQMVTGLVPGAVRTLLDYGTEAQKSAYIPRMASGEWLSTMCLTEPGAGSDLGRIRARAVQDGDAWKITGEKIFISGGDQDMTDEIFHLVLARTGDADSGVKGLSLFICLSHLPDGSRNPITVTRIEEKMGLHASPTCQMAFDGAQAELIGEEGAGLKAMFTMMNHARIDVALQGVAHATRAHDIAAAYCAERVQGRGADGQPVTLDQHADVRNMLNEMRALSLLGRAICHLAIVELEKESDPMLVEFLTPIAKHFCTESASRAADLGIQCLGGYGYLQEYRVEQVWRDARICRIYEGASGIHALTLTTRLLQGRAAEAADRFAAFTGANAPAEAVAHWTRARAALAGSTDAAAKAADFMALSEWLLLRALAPRFQSHAAAPEIASYLARNDYMGAVLSDRICAG
ncbi:acyl-CoA dehydrogenase family protein [Thalassovita sp.]|uniref:acyl-CoA dehydrogenase family protein n=1 Tax=Thalassovita sp. TaxID=1979401 RepID=UPI002880E3D4|nr:acyl-CoA dehydrogenase family protein [Thalassovita sp.]MDF1803700.1 acyl-CoA dehydrogenase family protein [Thalassovita sp.]